MSLSQLPFHHSALFCPMCERVAASVVTTTSGELLGCDVCAEDRVGDARTLSSEQWEAADDVQRALTVYGLTSAVASKVPTSPAKHQRAHVWLINAGERQFVLKRYHDWLANDAIRYEHSILAHLHAQQFPVAVPIGAVDGTTWMTLDGVRWVLYPALVGVHLTPDLWNFNLGKAADMLARMHVALRDFVPDGAPHPAWTAPTMQQIDTMVAGWPSLPELTPKLLADVRARLGARLFATAPVNLPRTIVHGEFNSANVLWQDGAITGVLDFERAHPNTPLWDLATGMWTRFPPVLRAAVALYGRVWRLTDDEREAIPDAILLGALLGIEAQLTIYKQPAEVARRVQDLAFALRDIEQLRKIAGCPPRV